MDSKEKKATGNGFFETFGRNGQPIKVYVPSKEEDEEDE
jgi:hypothetical protein